MCHTTQHYDLQVRLRRTIKDFKSTETIYSGGGTVRASGSVPEPRVSVGTVIGPRQLAWPLIGCGLGVCTAVGCVSRL